MYLPKYRPLFSFIPCIFLAIGQVQGTEIVNICYNSSLEGFRLNATVLMAKVVSQRIDCVMECATEPCCRSINYKKSMVSEKKSNCEMLHNVVYNISEKILMENSSYDYIYLFNPQKEYNSSCVSKNNFQGDVQKTPSVLSSTNLMTMMSSLVGNLVSSALVTSFVEIPTSITSSPSHSGFSSISNSQIYSSAIPSTLSDDSADTVHASCLQALKKNSSAQNGVYHIKTKTPQNYSNVYCHMASLPGCSGGGWTMVMKIDGNKETFSYSSVYWNNTKSYLFNNGMTGLDDKETKVSTYWSTPFEQLCVGMKIRNVVHFIPISYKANSLHDILAGGKFNSTDIPRETWKSLYVDSSLQQKCARQGFNVAAEITQCARVRIGIIGNNENDCRSADSFIGFGAIEANERDYCFKAGIINSCGNSAYCWPDNGDKEVKAMGYIFVR